MSRLLRIACLLAAIAAHLAPACAESEPPVTVRIEWGGGRPRAWSGTIRVVEGDPSGGPGGLEWRSLCGDADAAASIHDEGDALRVHDPRPRDHNGIQCAVDRWQTARIVVRLAPVGDPRAVTEIDVAVADVLADEVPRQLDGDGNRITIRRPAEDAIRVVGIDGARVTEGVRKSGEVVRLVVHPLLVSRSGATTSREVTMRVRDLIAGVDLASGSQLIHPVAEGGIALRGGMAAEPFEPVSFDVPLPDRDAVCQVALEVVERGSLRWSRPVAKRTVELAAVSDAPQRSPSGEWKVVYELDPASPRLHERLRRLSASMPSIPVPAVSMPSVKLPQLPFPTMTRPAIPLPKLPAVPVPSVSSIVPRVSGLLASGHSTVEPHPLGPMLQLPPARGPEEPTWEGVVIAGAEPGMPHLVEIEYPLDQEAAFGVSVFEANVAGTLVQSRHAGGFQVVPSMPPENQAIGRHSFIFWPTSRNPVVMVMNVSSEGAALFGGMRVFAGPARVPPMQAVSASAPGGDVRAARRVLGCVPAPSGLGFGAGGSVGFDAPRLPNDWHGILLGVRRSAEWFASQGAAGAMITVYKEGGAVWPSDLTHRSPRWSGTAPDGVDDSAGRDVLDVVCRMYGREGLRLVPALSFDAPLPALEAMVARHEGLADASTGIAVVGADGRARRLPGRAGAIHYNVLDPRVQQAVESLVSEFCDRIRQAGAVDGVAILLGHDGWFHLPGLEWGLDDVTFARFAMESGVESPSGEGRHAKRAALVGGRLREPWLAWRARELASFYGRLATLVARDAPRRSLYVAPTTLLAEGELAARFRPTLGEAPEAAADLWREIGVDPASLARERRIVFVSPHVHEGVASLIDRGTVERANRSSSLAAAVSGGRRAIVAVEQPVRVRIDDAVPHMPFGSAVAEGAVAVHPVAAGMAASRPWAESLATGDAEVIFDMALLHAQPSLEGLLVRRALAALPPDPLPIVAPLPAPLVIREGPSRLGTALLVVNASAVPVQADVELSGRTRVAADAVDGSRIDVDDAGTAKLALGPWGIRAFVVDAGLSVATARAVFADAVREGVAARLADVQARRDAVTNPPALPVLDNPDFELPDSVQGISGWELVERQRGSLVSLPVGRTEGGRAAAFSSINGLATLRSNPFTPPATGRVSVAAWLRVAEGDPQPPLRLAVEGVDRTGEYYRFAPVGGLPGAAPLRTSWTQFVLQIDSLPVDGLESLRVRFDLMGPGSVQIDDVRVFGLAFDEPQRTRLSGLIAEADQRLAAGDVGGCALLLDSFWPCFLVAHVPVAGADESVQPGGHPIARPPRRWTWR